jgi:hypothetical protein
MGMESSGATGRQQPRVGRLIWLLFLLAVLAGPGGSALGEWIDEGGAPASAFGLLLFFVGLVSAGLGKSVEHLVFSAKQRPWLGGRLKRWQRLILPFGTGTLVARGLTAAMAGGTVLLTSDPGWSALNVIALGFVILGGLLLGLALSRLLVGLVIVHRSGLWGASRRAWLIGGVVIALGAVASAINSVVVVLEIAPAV